MATHAMATHRNAQADPSEAECAYWRASVALVHERYDFVHRRGNRQVQRRGRLVAARVLRIPLTTQRHAICHGTSVNAADLG